MIKNFIGSLINRKTNARKKGISYIKKYCLPNVYLLFKVYNELFNFTNYKCDVLLLYDGYRLFVQSSFEDFDYFNEIVSILKKLYSNLYIYSWDIPPCMYYIDIIVTG